MGKGRAAGRVGSDFLSAIAGRVGSGQRFGGSGPRKVTRGQLWHTVEEGLDIIYNTEHLSAWVVSNDLVESGDIREK